MKSDEMLGTQVINTYLDMHEKFYPGKPMSADSIILANSKYPSAWLDGIGFQYRITLDEDYDKLEDAMLELARQSQGNIPKTSSFTSAFSMSGQNYSFFDAATAVISGSTGEIIKGAGEIGNSLIGTGKILLFLMPFAAVAFLYVYGKRKAESL